MSNFSTSAYVPASLASGLRASLLLAPALLGGCHGAAPAPVPPAPVVAMTVHPAAGGADGPSLRYPIEAAARYANPLSFRVSGQIVERRARLGDRVRRGAPLAQLDAADAERQAGAARAALDAAEHRLSFARQTLDRDQAQFAQHLVAQSTLEQSEDAYTAAQSARDQASDQWLVARNALQHHTLFAEHDGVITSENAEAGQYVAAGQAVYGLAWTGDIDVGLDAAAGDLGRIAVGGTAEVAFSALPGRRFAASVREVAPAADPQSRTYRVKLSLAPGPGLDAVRLGMTGTAVLPESARRTAAGAAPFRIPASAMFHQGSAPAVWVISAADSTLELRPVTVRTYSDRAVLVTGGLADGDRLVLAGVHTVFAGQRVTPVEPLFADDGADGPQ